MDDYLSKPVQPAELQRTLARVVQAGTTEQDPPASALQQGDGEALGPEGPETAATMVRLFEEALPPQLDALDAALARGDVVGGQREAHRLRGGCLQLGARAMAELCRRIEHSHKPDELPALAAALRASYRDTLEQLQRGMR